MKTTKAGIGAGITPASERFLNSKPPVGHTGNPPSIPPNEEQGGQKPEPRPFDAFWLGCYSGPLGTNQLSPEGLCEWIQEMTDWVHSQGWSFCDRYPHRFYVINTDPGTKKKIDLPRRDFFRVVSKFKQMNEKYGLCLTGCLIYNKEPSAPPQEACVEFFIKGQHVSGESIGRPGHSKLPFRKKRH
jgi:hypothetical protein